MVSGESPNVHVGRDEEGRVRVLRHPQEGFSAEDARLTEPSPRELADAYVRDVVAMYDLTEEQTADLAGPVQREPVEEGPRLKFDQLKTVVDTVVVAYQQTALALPIWQAALQVRIYGDPPRVASSDSTLHYDVELESLPPDQLGRYADEASVREALGLDDAAAEGLRVNDARGGSSTAMTRATGWTRRRPATAKTCEEESRACRSLRSPTPSSRGATTSCARCSSRFRSPSGAS